MAIVVGNKSFYNAPPNASSRTQAHNHDVGADGLLLVAVAMTNTVNFSGCTYGGQSMTQSLSVDVSADSQRIRFYTLKNPPTGNNDVVISFTGNQWNNISMAIFSFTGADIGNTLTSQGSPTPHTESITVSQANSLIFAHGMGVFQILSINIDGSNRPLEFTHNNNRQVSAGISTPMTTGSKDIIVTSTTSSNAIQAIEITEAGGGTPTPTGEGDFFMMF